MDLGKKILEYSKGYAKALLDGEIEAPSGADCWLCYMETTNGESLGDVAKDDHLALHIEEGYFVPSLFMRAVKKYPGRISQYLAATIQDLWYDDERFFSTIGDLRSLMEHQAKRLIRRYLRCQFGMKG